MKPQHTICLNTLDKAFQSARTLSKDLANQESKTGRNYRIFSALAANEREALVAFLIWRTRAETMKELASG